MAANIRGANRAPSDGMAVLFAILIALACWGAVAAGSQTLNSGQLQTLFQNTNTPFTQQNASYFAGTAMFESSGQTGAYNSDHYGLMQLSSGNIKTYANGMDPTTFMQQSPQFQVNTWNKYFTATMSDGSNKELQSMMKNGQCLNTSSGCQTITPGFIAGCSQLGDTRCQHQIDSGCSRSTGNGADTNGTTLCDHAAKADANAGKSSSNSTNSSSNSTNASNSTNSTNTTPSNPARSNPCTCPGNREGTDAELMKEACATNRSTYQNWPHTGTGYLGSPPPKQTQGTDICDPAAPSRVPDNFSPVPNSNTPNTSNTANTPNAANTANAGNATGGGALANNAKLQQDVASGQCLSNSHGPCQCVTLVHDVTNLPPTNQWVRGDPVVGGNVASGTPVATFDANGNYTGISGQAHTGIFNAYSQDGSFNMYDQYHSSTIGNKGPGLSSVPLINNNHPAEAAGQYYTIKIRGQ